ncbi:PREDICTED: C-type natriuretic peptide prohormone-like [Buceros rhinoceros silvestris]|uniref:C-type natriuretic peptide prohormone-like n=1 Tax=Buceros rhinoceros silvestris TaxID=175836 RepID=UPI0005286BCD|nr:PREDICTED: C-type natriuretic peptide prohormone-like [Buceros rhinoceros silvestris]
MTEVETKFSSGLCWWRPSGYVPALHQSLSKLLDVVLEHPLVSEERDHEQDDMIPVGALDQQNTELQWTQSTRDQPEGVFVGDSAVQKFFSDLLSLSCRFRSRSKKGLSRGCFGVRLDRIGSLSGLGC